MPSLKHIHQYQKVKWGRNGTVIWKCALLGCSHYLHVEFILGKTSTCWKCGDRFVITPIKLLRAKPKCDKCQHASGQGPQPKIKREKMPDLRDFNIDELLDNL